MPSRSTTVGASTTRPSYAVSTRISSVAGPVSVVPSGDSGWAKMIAVLPVQQFPSAFHSR